MISAERQLEILRRVDEIADGAGSLPALAESLAVCLARETRAAEVLLLTTEAPDGMIQQGPLGREDLSEEVRRLARMVREPGTHWEETVSGDLVARPLRPGGRLVGIVIVRKPGGLSGEDRAALECFEQRADSAVAHALDKELLRERNLELTTIYEIDHIRDLHLDFPEMLQRVMGRVLDLVPADCAVVALRPLVGPGDLRLFARARAGQRELTARFLSTHRDYIEGIVDRTFAARAFREERLPGEARDVACMPLILDDEILGGFVLLAQPGRHFTQRDRRLFRAVCSQVDTAIFEDVQRQRLKEVFKRYVSKDVFAEMLKSEEDFLEGRRREVSCFFSDLRGFTSVSEQLPVDVVVGMLNEHLEAMTEIVFAHGGTVDKFIGDCVMAFFGAPLAYADHALRAVRAACAMRERHNEIAEGWAKRGLPAVKIGVGLHTGEVFVGNIGGDKLTSYTIIGDHVNLASRLEGVSGPDDVIISAATLSEVEPYVEVEPRGEIVVKGKTIAVEIFNVKSVRAA